MKRIIAIVCAMAMVLSFAVSASAADWDFLSQKYTSYEAKVEFGLKLNKPLEFLSLFNEDAGMDVKYFVEELTKAKYTADIKAETTDDMRSAKIAMAVNSDVPINLSEDLKFGADITLNMWMEFDFTSVENAKYNIVVKNPLSGQYIYIDFFELMESADSSVDYKKMIVETFENAGLQDGIAEIVELVKKVYEKNASLDRKGNEYTVTFTNAGIVDMFFDVLTGYAESEYFKNISGAETEDIFADVDLPAIKTTVKELGIFEENSAYIMKLKFDRRGIIMEATEQMNIDFNICELAMALGAEQTDLYPLTKENSDVDMSFKATAVYDKVNQKDIVKMPVMTEENSIDLAQLIMEQIPQNEYDDYYFDEDYYFEEEYQPEQFWDYATGLMDRGGMYVDMEDFLQSAQWDEDALTGSCIFDEAGNVSVEIGNKYMSAKLAGNTEKDGYSVDGVEKMARKPFKLVEEYSWETYAPQKRLYINVEILAELLECKASTVTTYLIDENGITLTTPVYEFELVRPNKGYVEPEDTIIDFPEATMIDVIGGADGPTAVLVTE